MSLTAIAAVVLGAVVLAAVGLMLYGRSQRKRGRAEANAEGLESAVEAARKSGEIDEDVARLSDADLYNELHDDGGD